MKRVSLRNRVYNGIMVTKFYRAIFGLALVLMTFASACHASCSTGSIESAHSCCCEPSSVCTISESGCCTVSPSDLLVPQSKFESSGTAGSLDEAASRATAACVPHRLLASVTFDTARTPLHLASNKVYLERRRLLI